MVRADGMQCGLLGRKLGHSYSPEIHTLLATYAYRLFEREEEEVGAFLRSDGWDALNVTIPYKKTVLPYLDEVSETVRLTGSANTVVRRSDGSLYGDNTDVFGFTETVRRSGLPTDGVKALVLGSGGASVSVVTALRQLNARPVVISRSGEDNYGNLDRHCDAEIIVNATPVGMYPNNGVSPVDLARFPACRGVFDLIYNPAKTALLLQAESLGVPYENGLYMLVAQAVRSAELFTGERIPGSEIERVHRAMRLSMRNIVLIGMPGVGKTTVAERLRALTGREALDSDEEITRRTGSTPAQIIREQGEDAFRAIETGVLSELGRRSGIILATGGGAVVRAENRNALRQNGTVVWLRRELASLSSGGRPLTERDGVEALYRQRKDKYAFFADCAVELDTDVTVSADRVLAAFES